MKRRMAVEGELKKMEDKGKRSMNLQNFPKARIEIYIIPKATF